jgi:hypothetical protein
MRDKEIVGLWEAYTKIYEQVQSESVEEVDNYDEILEYLLSEGYSKEESDQIMVELINEDRLGALIKGAGAVAKFVAGRAKTPLRTAATDSLITSTALNPVSTAKVAKTIAKSAPSPAPIVKTVKLPAARTAPKGANKITTNVWNEPTAPSSRINPSKPSGPKVSSTKALSGTPSRPALPSAGNTSASVKAPKPTFKPEALPKATKSAEPGGALVPTKAPKPTFKPEALPRTNPTVEPGGALVRTKAPKPTFKPEALPRNDAISEPGGALVRTKAPKPTAKRSTSGGGKPSKGGGLTQTVRATLSPAEKTGNMKYPGLEKYATGSSSSGGPSKSTISSLSRNLKTAGTVATGTVALDQIGKENKRKQDQKNLQSIKTNVYNTMDLDSTIRSRKKVGPKIVGTGSIAGDFDVAFKKARTSGQKQFEFSGKKYNTKMKENFEYQNTRSIREEIVSYLLDEGFASDEKSAEAILGAMSEAWIDSIVEAKIEPPKEKVGALINIDIPQNEREAARQRTLAKAKKMREKRENKD